MRDKEFLEELISDEYSMKIIDTTLYILNELFKQMKENGLSSAVAYFGNVKVRNIILYSVFTIILLTTFILFVSVAFKKIKISIWNTNLALKMIPSDSMSKKDYKKVQSFFYL